MDQGTVIFIAIVVVLFAARHYITRKRGINVPSDPDDTPPTPAKGTGSSTRRRASYGAARARNKLSEPGDNT